jgi:hypothetical protein
MSCKRSNAFMQTSSSDGLCSWNYSVQKRNFPHEKLFLLNEFSVELFAYFSLGSSAARKFEMQENVNIFIRNVEVHMEVFLHVYVNDYAMEERKMLFDLDEKREVLKSRRKIWKGNLENVLCWAWDCRVVWRWIFCRAWGDFEETVEVREDRDCFDMENGEVVHEIWNFVWS